MKKLTVVSLCDGISIGRLALEQLGYEVDYYRAEIKDIANKVAMKQFPNSHNLGDVTKITYKNGVLHSEYGDYHIDKIDMVIFGFPCQSESQAMKKHMRVGLKDSKRSGLFYECNRILKECSPTYYFVENVGSMKKEDLVYVTDQLGNNPIKINSSYFGPQLRNRYYWCNWEIEKPKDNGIALQTILTEGYTNREKARALLVSDSRPLTTPIKMFHRYYSTGFTTLIFKSKEHYELCLEKYKEITNGIKVSADTLDNCNESIFNGVRYLNQEELEKCQGVPLGYTSCLTRNEAADCLGDCWTLPVIKYCFSFMEENLFLCL